jgi:hypothetical protein
MKASRLGLLLTTNEYIIIHDITNGKCTIENKDGRLDFIDVEDVAVYSILKGMNVKQELSASDIDIIKERLNKINGI